LPLPSCWPRRVPSARRSRSPPREGILLGFWSVLYATAAPSARVDVSAVALAALLVSGVALLELRISNRSRRSVDAQSDPLAPKLVRQEPPVSSPAR